MIGGARDSNHDDNGRSHCGVRGRCDGVRGHIGDLNYEQPFA